MGNERVCMVKGDSGGGRVGKERRGRKRAREEVREDNSRGNKRRWRTGEERRAS